MTYFIRIQSILFIALCFSSSLFLGSCTKESSENLTIETLNVDEQLVPYFERFVEAGTLRGLEVDLVGKRIEGFLVNIEETGVVGQCSYSATSTRKVNIDLNYWNSATDLEKEFVIFHELGHCYLERSHSDVQENRNCTSIMHSGTSSCRFRYTISSRDAYIDELFQF